MPAVVGTNPLDVVTNTVLEDLAKELKVDRAYVFHFRGRTMSNTHEYVTPGTTPFKDKLATVPCHDLPFITREMRNGRHLAVEDLSELPPTEASKELLELETEHIRQLALTPVKANGTHMGRIYSGFVGVDVCEQERRSWGADTLMQLENYGAFIFGLQALMEFFTGVSPVRADSTMMSLKPKPTTRKVHIQTLLNGLMRHSSLFGRFRDVLLGALPGHDDVLRPLSFKLMPLPLSSIRTHVQREAAEHFKEHRYAKLQPSVWESDGVTSNDMDNFLGTLLHTVHNHIQPDIPPYTKFRDVGYARYRYRNGTIYPLKHKSFFQVNPEANVLLNSKPRPFARLPDPVRLHPILSHMLRVLLERVWCNELGPEVHVNVHPLRVRNFHEGKIHDEAYATFEGTHIDSTHRVAVVLLERNNVHPDAATTALYLPECPIGLRRDKPSDTAQLDKLRVTEVTMKKAFEAITFDDNCFKHDASKLVPEDATKEMSRCVMLIMCRVPCPENSPVDGGVIDGYTPRSPRPAQADKAHL